MLTVSIALLSAFISNHRWSRFDRQQLSWCGISLWKNGSISASAYAAQAIFKEWCVSFWSEKQYNFKEVKKNPVNKCIDELMDTSSIATDITSCNWNEKFSACPMSIFQYSMAVKMADLTVLIAYNLSGAPHVFHPLSFLTKGNVSSSSSSSSTPPSHSACLLFWGSSGRQFVKHGLIRICELVWI